MSDRPPARCPLCRACRFRLRLEPAITVIDFYLARIEEAEAEVDGHRFDYTERDTGVSKCRHRSHVSGYSAICWRAEVSARVLADCQAKRRLFEMYLAEADQPGPAVGKQEAHTARLGALADVIQTLAAAYKDHEDWNPDWGVAEPGSNR